jgi:hypothetical protein
VRLPYHQLLLSLVVYNRFPTIALLLLLPVVVAGSSLACTVKVFSSSSSSSSSNSSSSSALAFAGYSNAAAAQSALDGCLLEVLTR